MTSSQKGGALRDERQRAAPPPLKLFHMGHNPTILYGVFFTETTEVPIPTHLGIGARATDERLQVLADRHGFTFAKLKAFRDAGEESGS